MNVSAEALKNAEEILNKAKLEPSTPDDVLTRMLARLNDRESLDLIPDPKALIDGVLDRATIAWLSGKYGSYKSFTSVSWACSIATGVPWLGHSIMEKGPVLYIAGEGISGLKKRVRAWEIGNLGGERVEKRNLYIYDGRIRLNDSQQLAGLKEIVKRVKPILTIVDTWHKCAPGVNENDATEASVIFDAAADLREDYGTTVLFNHHTGHRGDRPRGTSSIEDDADTSWLITMDGEERGPETARTLVHRKAKDGAEHEEIPLELVIVPECRSGYLRKAAALPDSVAVVMLAGKLDADGVPRGLSGNATQTAGAERGLKARREIWLEVAKVRKRPLEEG